MIENDDCVQSNNSNHGRFYFLYFYDSRESLKYFVRQIHFFGIDDETILEL